MKTILTLLLALIVISGNSQQHENAFEADVIWPFVAQAFRGHYVRTLWQNKYQHGDLLLGLNIDFPRDRATEGNFADYSIATGYRHYFIRGFHLEVNQTTGLGILKNHVSTNSTYRSFDWLASAYVGYLFHLSASKKIYLNPQFGTAQVVFKSNPWPIYEDDSLQKEIGEKPFIVGTLRLGFKF